MAIKDLFKLKKKEQQPKVEAKDSKFQSSGSQGFQGPQGIQNTQSQGTQGPFTDSSENVPSTSTSFTSNNTDFIPTSSNSNIYNQYNNLNSNQDIPRELVPIITLINCQNSRIYLQDQLYLNIEKNDGGLEQDLSYQIVDGLIKGNQLILHNSNNEFKPISINLLEATVKLVANELSLILSSSNKLAYHLKFTSLDQLQNWISSIKLSNFEFNHLNQSYTASLLSSKATLLSDIHVLMAETKYKTGEWVNIKFKQDSNWIKSYCIITPSDKSKKNKKVKNGSIQFYTSSKANKKHLICSINSIDSCFAVYPNHVDLIDDSTLLRLNGDLNIYNLGLKIDDIDTDPTSPISRTNSIKSNSPPPSGGGNLGGLRSRSNSNRSHLRSSSISSIGSSKSLKSWNINNTSLYILPKTHNAVKNFETLIRFLLPLYDSFQLYGRPKRLISEKNDYGSLLFGLPSLPHTEYLTSQLARDLIQQSWSKILTNDEFFNYNLLFSNKIQSLYQSTQGFKGFGDLKKTLNNEITFEDPIIKFNNNLTIPDFQIDPQQTPKYAFSINDLPINANDNSNSNFNLNAPLSAGPTSSTTPVQGQGHLRIPSSSSNFQNQNQSLLNSSSYLQNSLNYGNNGNQVPIIKSPRLRSNSTNIGNSNSTNFGPNLSINNTSNGNSNQTSPILSNGFTNDKTNPTNSIPAVA
ncbi:hypothetical protein BN7_5394 [Wickerhamomyces ciferrii]|uniref:Skg3/CAF120-like PH-like domain-containing protein n=1 Tax=Wickerhamomyces ciferrii (strain ATCC 14091 / BCRC 22168 / CBS 111 / JCM 3599 / NBRC 0793 / NRRL Y-1031 F-60-10) TaxID=1206466 RepID=K0KXN0_WICCF|nr:uncharacterized protein BN7_5394 [Wickerhamomyces ciferrii]CCH45808.1 hypothetical protein BN7_5394 [Wickerhamomyces ciferrii]